MINENELAPLAKIFIMPLGLTTTTSAAEAVIQKKNLGSGMKLIISNKEMDDIMKILKSLEESGLLIKVASETIKNGMLLGKLYISADKGIIQAGGGVIRASENFYCCLILNFETRKYFQNEPKFDNLYSKLVFLK